MFDKDKEFGNRLDQAVSLGEPFILHAVAVPKGRTIKTDISDETQVAELTIEKMRRGKGTGEKLDTTTVASAIVEKCRQSKSGDLPAVVELRKVGSRFGNEALVLQWLRDYTEADAKASGEAQSAQDDDIPY